MEELTTRRQQFQREADRVLVDIVRPRLETLAGFFANAGPARKCEVNHCTWWFGYTERFPASVKIELSIEHDAPCENLLLAYELSILPSFSKYERFDRLALPLGAFDDATIAGWLEQCLLRFVRIYTALARTDRDQVTSLATDPVCGMRIDRDHAAASAKHAGHDYFFCSAGCRDDFVAEPERYVRLALV
ncbi:MAG: YHS domain-containing protein [Planctomycetes bacterium]|nr:YHS domain-containing protein [Planctomycetota bacterium]